MVATTPLVPASTKWFSSSGRGTERPFAVGRCACGALAEWFTPPAAESTSACFLVLLDVLLGVDPAGDGTRFLGSTTGSWSSEHPVSRAPVRRGQGERNQDTHRARTTVARGAVPPGPRSVVRTQGLGLRLDRVEVAYGVAVVLPLLLEDHVQAGAGGLRVSGVLRVLARRGQLV